MAHTLTYLFDPLCGWCYGASRAINELIRLPGIELRLAPTGLFSAEGARPMDAAFADYAWANDQRITRLTGQQFSERYRDEVLTDRTRLFDSGPATLALTAVSLTKPKLEFEALKAFQTARYVHAKDITSLTVLAAILSKLGLEESAEAIRQPSQALIEANQRRTADARQLMRKFGAQGVPTIIVGEDPNARLLHSSALYGPFDNLTAQIAAA